MFVHEPQPTERQVAQRQTDQMIEEKLGSSGVIAKSIAWISGTIAGPIISFFKRNGLAIALGILGFVFLLKLERLSSDVCPLSSTKKWDFPKVILLFIPKA